MGNAKAPENGKSQDKPARPWQSPPGLKPAFAPKMLPSPGTRSPAPSPQRFSAEVAPAFTQ